MTQASQEPSMEEILASIRRIISEDKKPKRSSQARSPSASGGSSSVDDDGNILELNHPLSDHAEPQRGGNGLKKPPEMQQNPPNFGFLGPRPASKTTAPFLSEETVSASREAFHALDRSPIGSLSNKTLEEVVENALRPFLKEWLDTHLPALVKQVVREQVERIARPKTLS